MTRNAADSADSRDLTITRALRAPRAALWRAWSEPDLLKVWWCPKPWTTDVLAFDLKPGGAFHTLMKGPDGGISDNPGCFLEIVPQSRLAFTSMLTAGWRPNTPWMGITAIITMTDEGEGTRYVAHAMHPDDASREQHEKLGFFDGWNTVITQLDELACTLR
ncbi:SRPBCC family protein [Burkholderia multivorans]|uniref:SRPBCC family protein n=1 Tax=Burkholderia multivorans TaxID=87883 RepID=UPI0021C0A0FA|nr:SRPBCC family protein [Burkholderia multivorans]